jgi:hypothetical protein
MTERTSLPFHHMPFCGSNNQQGLHKTTLAMFYNRFFPNFGHQEVGLKKKKRKVVSIQLQKKLIV